MIISNLVDINDLVPLEPGERFRIARPKWIVSLDIGMVNDPTAVCVLEYFTRKAVVDEYTFAPQDVQPTLAPIPKEWYVKCEGGMTLAYPNAPARINVRHLERLPLNTYYPDQVDYIKTLMRRPPLDRVNPKLLLDQTGVGAPVRHYFERSGLRPIGVNITGGDEERRDPHNYHTVWNVPKLILVSRLQTSLHERILHISNESPEANVLKGELMGFRASFSDTGHVRLGHRESAHDDIVLSLAIGNWYASREYYATQIGTYTV